MADVCITSNATEQVTAAAIPHVPHGGEPSKSVNDCKPAYVLVPYSSVSSSSHQSAHSSSSSPSAFIDLHVTNLDQSIGAKEMKTLLSRVFKQHVMVCLINCFRGERNIDIFACIT